MANAQGVGGGVGDIDRDGDVGGHGDKHDDGDPDVEGGRDVGGGGGDVEHAGADVEDYGGQHILDGRRAAVQLPRDLPRLAHQVEGQVQVQGVGKQLHADPPAKHQPPSQPAVPPPSPTCCIS